jgi:hypothetical protein
MDVERYLAIHDRCIEITTRYFVEQSNFVAPSSVAHDEIRIEGDLICQGGLVIHISETLERDRRNQVRCIDFRYQAQFAGPPHRRIFRYDNAHIYSRRGHPDAFQKHVFSNRSWRETSVEHIGRHQFPTLPEVIDELFDCWVQNRDDPLVYP